MRDKTYLGDEIPGKQNFPQIHDIFTKNSFSVFPSKMSELSENVLTREQLSTFLEIRFCSRNVLRQGIYTQWLKIKKL